MPPSDQLMEAVALARPDFLRFAQLQVRDRDAAEDIVQEALEAALRGIDKFSGRSSVKTWVFGILKNKIIDHLRQKNRSIPFSELIGDDTDSGDKLDALFNERGHWLAESRPEHWNAPESALESDQFWQVFDVCLNHLPENTSRVFMMREFLGFDSKEICAELSLSTTHCHVILHRARARLRGCLEAGWFSSGADHA